MQERVEYNPRSLPVRYLLCEVLFPPCGVVRGDQVADLCQVDVLEVAIPQTVVHSLLAQVLQRHLGLGPDVLQLNLRRHLDAHRVDVEAQDVAQSLCRDTDHLFPHKVCQETLDGLSQLLLLKANTFTSTWNTGDKIWILQGKTGTKTWTKHKTANVTEKL